MSALTKLCNMSSSEIYCNLDEKQKSELYTKLVSDHIYQDAIGRINSRNLENEIYDIAAYVSKDWTENGKYDCNLSYWDNMDNLIDKHIELSKDFPIEDELIEKIVDYIIEDGAASESGSRYIYFDKIEEHFNLKDTWLKENIEKISDKLNECEELIDEAAYDEECFDVMLGLNYLTDLHSISEMNPDVYYDTEARAQQTMKVLNKLDKYIDSGLYNEMQLVQIQVALYDEIEPNEFADPKNSWQEMREIRQQIYNKIRKSKTR